MSSDTPVTPSWLAQKQARELVGEPDLTPHQTTGGCIRIGYSDGCVVVQGFPFDPDYALTFEPREAIRLGKGLQTAGQRALKKA